jgi:hypothetical protein
MSTETEYRRLIESKGISLQCLGIAEIALTRLDAILAASLLRNASIPILGGDVFFKKPAGIELAYANWHSDPMEGEDRERFAIRSCLDALNYIESFPSTEAVPLFVLVIDF